MLSSSQVEVVLVLQVSVQLIGEWNPWMNFVLRTKGSQVITWDTGGKVRKENCSWSPFLVGKGICPSFLEPVECTSEGSPRLRTVSFLNTFLAVIHSGRFLFENGFLFVLACCSRHRSVGGRLGGAPGLALLTLSPFPPLLLSLAL